MLGIASFFRSKWLLLLLILITFSQYTYAQEISVSGTVTAASDGLPLAGVSVKVKGSVKGTSTDVNGKFALKALQSNAVLVFSFVGFKTVEQSVDGRTSINIKLEDEAKALGEVVVVGYGTARKKDLTGSVVVVNSKDFQKGNMTSPEQMIAGKVPGVSISSNSGQPGAGSTIRIRGGASLNASNDPLIVIDGVLLDNSAVAGASYALSLINPNDIESFTILKDASAAAIYGARASNGVIIITTKKGNSGQLKVNFSSVNSVSSVINYVDVLSGDQVRAIVNESGSPDLKSRLGASNTDWQKEIYRAGFGTDNNISFSGGLKNLPYRVSVGYQKTSGTLKTDNLQRTSLALAFNPSFFDKHLSVNVNLKGSAMKTRFGNLAAIGGAVSFDPTQAIMSETSIYNGYFEHLRNTNDPLDLYNLQGRNPVGLLNQRKDIGKPLRSIGNIQFDYKFHFLPELRANLNLGYDIARGQGTVVINELAAESFNVGGRNDSYKQNRENTLLDFYLNYVKDIKSISSRVDLTAGYSYNNYLTRSFNYPGYNYKKEVIPGTEPTYPFGDSPKYRLISYFARTNYTLADKYLVTATIRRDGSSRFGESNKYGYFPSVALGWTVSNESFLKGNTIISNLKLRAGYGITGQQDFNDDFAYLARYSLSTSATSYQFGDTYYQMYRPSRFVSTIKWEETATTNFAIDYGFLQNRISGSIEYYYKKTKDLLADANQAAGTNFSATAFQNIGNMENRGVEFNINATPVTNKNFRWEAAFNISYNKNRVTNLTLVPNDPDFVGQPTGGISGGVGGSSSQLNTVGESRNTFYLFRQIYDAAGKPIDGVFEDLNNDGVVNLNDRYLSKSAMPDYFLGYTNTLTYKKWSTGFVLRANIGNYAYNNNFSRTGTLNQVVGSPVIYNGSPNYLQTGFQGSEHQLLSDYYLQNASFLKMDNFNISYNAGKLFNQKASLQLNGTVQNVFTITKYKGLDPEVGGGVDNNIYPRPRTFSIGLNLTY
jgi:TonB-dependent starch-binding outer membrane protein SusC